MKSGPLVRIVLLVTGIIAAGAAVRWIDRMPYRQLASVLGVSITVSDSKTPAPAPTSSQSPLPLVDQVPELSAGTVAIQTFSGAQLIRTTTGTSVSSDGLIVAVAHAVPYGGGAYTYQITTDRGTRERAKRIYIDISRDLVLLKIGGSDHGMIAFHDDIALRAGDRVSAIGATVVLAQYVPLVLPVDIVYSASPEHIACSIDRSYSVMATGARLITDDGTAIGLLQSDSSSRIISARNINTVVAAYLALPQQLH